MHKLFSSDKNLKTDNQAYSNVKCDKLREFLEKNPLETIFDFEETDKPEFEHFYLKQTSAEMELLEIESPVPVKISLDIAIDGHKLALAAESTMRK